MSKKSAFFYPISEIRPNRIVFFSLHRFGEEYPCFLIFDQKGVAFAYRNFCPHWGVKLNNQAEIAFLKDKQKIRCDKHDAIFECSTGRCVAGPCENENLRRLQISRIDSMLKIQLSSLFVL